MGGMTEGSGLTAITTAGVAPAGRSRHWHAAIRRAYFPLDLVFRRPDRFDGDLTIWELGAEVSISRLASDPLLYRRRRHHLLRAESEELLVTIPARAELRFAQGGRELRGRPGAFFLERSHEPYEFSHADRAEMWVVKLPLAALAERVRAPDRFCSLLFDAANGANALFVDMVHLIPARHAAMDGPTRALVGRQLVELLALALRADGRAVAGGTTAVRAAHLARIEQVLRRDLARHDLGPEAVAAACGISVRYLHALFRDTGETFGQRLRELRLAAARDALARADDGRTIGDIAWSVGFADHAQFSRAFRARYGMSPREARLRA